VQQQHTAAAAAAVVAAAVKTTAGAKTPAGEHVAKIPVSDAATHVYASILCKTQERL
jgi:hypothetical protein